MTLVMLDLKGFVDGGGECESCGRVFVRVLGRGRPRRWCQSCLPSKSVAGGAELGRRFKRLSRGEKVEPFEGAREVRSRVVPKPPTSMRALYATAEWQRIRKVVLARDGHWCMMRCTTKCRGTANAVDHIVRPEDGGALYDPSNLQACCVPCNTAKRNRQAAERARLAYQAAATPLRPW